MFRFLHFERFVFGVFSQKRVIFALFVYFSRAQMSALEEKQMETGGCIPRFFYGAARAAMASAVMRICSSFVIRGIPSPSWAPYMPK